MITNKVCTKCKVMKSLEEYHNLKNGVYGKHSNCKSCRKIYRKDLSFKKPIKGKIKCEKCNKIKNVNDFYKDRSKSTGLQSYCINCQKEKVYECSSKLESYLTYYLSLLKKQNSTKNLDNQKNKKTLNNKLESESEFKSQSESESELKSESELQLESDFKLKLEDLLEIYEKQNRKCALTRELLTYYNGKCLTENKYEKKFNIKIQKIDNDKGFYKDNIILIGNTISKMIGNMELNEFKRICKLISE